jgi:hypothetical protein
MLVMFDIKAASALEDNVGSFFAPWLYGVSTLHCLTVSLAHGGTGLGTMWGEQLAVRMLADAGFVVISVRRRTRRPVRHPLPRAQPTCHTHRAQRHMRGPTGAPAHHQQTRVSTDST